MSIAREQNQGLIKEYFPLLVYILPRGSQNLWGCDICVSAIHFSKCSCLLWSPCPCPTIAYWVYEADSISICSCSFESRRAISRSDTETIPYQLEIFFFILEVKVKAKLLFRTSGCLSWRRLRLSMWEQEDTEQLNTRKVACSTLYCSPNISVSFPVRLYIFLLLNSRLALANKIQMKMINIIPRQSVRNMDYNIFSLSALKLTKFQAESRSQNVDSMHLSLRLTCDGHLI